jgi:hypothetical protein
MPFFFRQTCQISRSPSNLNDLGDEGTTIRNYSLSDRLSYLKSLRFFLKCQNVLTSKFWPHLIQRFIIINLCSKILARCQMFEAKKWVPVTSASPAWIMLNNLWYTTVCITLKLKTHYFTAAKNCYPNVYSRTEGLLLCAELLLHRGKRQSCLFV